MMRLADEHRSSLSVRAEVFRCCLSALINLIRVLAAHYLDFNTWQLDLLERELSIMQLNCPAIHLCFLCFPPDHLCIIKKY